MNNNYSMETKCEAGKWSDHCYCTMEISLVY